MLGGCQWPEFGLWRSSWALWFSAGILGQGKDELSKMHTEKLGRGEDNLAWLCSCFREWQSPAPCPSQLGEELTCPVLRASTPRAPVALLAPTEGSVLLCAPCLPCLMMPLIRGAVSLISQGRQRKEPWCPWGADVQMCLEQMDC